MSQHYLLDGYNIIKQTQSLSRGKLEDQRLALLRWISFNRPQGSASNTVMVVFDGKDEFFGSHSESNIKVVFSKVTSADEVIKRIVEDYPYKQSIVVVSDDKDIKLYVRALGAQVLSVKEFVGAPYKKSKKIASSSAAESKHISLAQENKINKEMEKIWIKKDQ